MATERYLDLTRFYDVAAAKARRDELIARSDAYRSAYTDAYRALRAADAVESERRAAVSRSMDYDKLSRRFDGILRREIHGNGSRHGRVDRAFLGGMTHKGDLCRFDTVEALCPRRFVIADSYGFAAAALEHMGGVAALAGYDTLVCMNPDRPREASHLLIPALELAFITSTVRMPYSGEAYRRVRVDAMAGAKLTRAEKSKIRLMGRIEYALRDEAKTALARAKREHDALEAAYNPCVDFDGVYELAAQEARRLLQS